MDALNWRLPQDLVEREQTDLLRYYFKHYDLEEIGWSIAEHGYWDEEPLLTIRTELDDTQRIVVEGNRRLATLRLLTSAEARQTVSARTSWDELSEFASDHDLSQVPVRNYDDREELLDYLGFRHVSGLLSWKAEAKARYVHALVVDHDYDFQHAGRVIGSRGDAIRRQFIAWRTLEQGRSAGIDVSAAITHFGVFYRALQNPAVREFLRLQGWVDGSETTLEPLGLGGTERLAELIGFVFGPDRVIRESRALDELARALIDDRALALLRESRDLAIALQELPADRDAVFGSIRLAYRHAASANAEAFLFAGDAQLVEEAERLEELTRQLVRSLGELPQASSAD